MKKTLLISAAIWAGTAVTGVGLSALNAATFDSDLTLVGLYSTPQHTTVELAAPVAELAAPVATPKAEPVQVAQAAGQTTVINDASEPWLIYYDQNGNPVYASRPIDPAPAPEAAVRPNPRPTDRIVVRVTPQEEIAPAVAAPAPTPAPAPVVAARKPAPVIVPPPAAKPKPVAHKPAPAPRRHAPQSIAMGPAYTDDVGNPALIGVYR